MIATGTSTSTLLNNKQLLFTIRLLWLFFIISGFVLGLLSYIELYKQPTSDTNPAQVLIMAQIGSYSPSLLLFFRFLEFGIFIITVLVAVFIFWQRSYDWLAIFLSLCLLAYNLADAAPVELISLPLAHLCAVVGRNMGFILFFIFPTGKFVPRFARWLMPLLISISAAAEGWMRFKGDLSPESGEILPVFLGVLAVLMLGLAAQIYRYRYISTSSQRQQTKWVMLGLVAIFVFTSIPITAFLTLSEYLQGNNLNSTLINVLLLSMQDLAFALTPLIMLFAILRYRLWDIDVVINRSLVGLIVTIFLLLIFVPSVFLIQSVLGAENTFASFLVSAAIPALLFNPTRKRVRQFVDQRIYGFKFDLNELRAAQQKPEIKNAGALTGKQLGQYEVLDFIGKGGMGEVYKGYAAGQTVALKTLPSHLAKEGDFLRRFQREAEVMQKLEHPKIVRLCASGETEGQLYLAMEFIEGIELKDYLQEKLKLDLETAREILGDIAEALDYLHSQNIVHRDIKPSNIMLRGDDPQEAILMDFGIAKIEDGKTRLTGSGAIGTIDYMSPEQIMAAKEVDKRADVYALGVIAYEMLTGERPFKGSAAQVMFAHLQQPVTEPRQHNPNLSEAVSSAILKALEKQAENRFESAGAFAAALASV